MATTTQAANGKPGEVKLPDQAATAALYVTGSGKQTGNNYPLDADGKLSSASAAMSLKRAEPRDLPSYPSPGLANKASSAGAAASLAARNKRSFEHWKPGQIAPANKAALIASDIKPAPQWQPPEASAAGSKAALLAHRSGSRVDSWQPDISSETNSAAGIALRSKSKSPATSAGKDRESHSKALSAATGAMSTRRRSGSLPAQSYEYPDSSNSVRNALNAATKASRPSKPAHPPPDDLPGLSDEDAIRIHNAAVTNLSRDMYTSLPPVKPEIEERNRQAGLKAAAVSMAKNMYDAQQRVLESYTSEDSQSHQAARNSHSRQASVEPDRREQAMQYLNLQATAQKLAAERLAKLNDESAEYRSYYGTTSPIRSRLSLRGRRRSSSDSVLSDTDKARSEKIRSEMSLFNSKLAEVDSKKRQKDRDALLAAAQRNVTKNMQGLDEKVFEETGKASPAMRADWESKARAKAEAESKTRLQNYGKVDIGGGKFLDQSEVNAIAAAKVQPTLDDITEKAEEQRALDEKRRLEAEEERRVAEEKAAEEKEGKKKTREVWKQFKDQEKEDKKVQKEEEQAQKIYEATAAEQDRKAEALERQEAATEAAKVEQERDEKTKQEWSRFKEAEKQNKKAQKEDEKAKKAEQKRAREEELKAFKEEEKAKKEEERAIKVEEKQEKRKLRGASFAAMAAAIGIGEKEKEKDKERDNDKPKAESQSKSPEPIDLQPQTIEEEPKETKSADDAAVTSEPEEQTTESSKEPPPMTLPKTAFLQAAPVGIAKPAAQPTSPSSLTGETSPKEQGRVSSWFKSKFGRRSSRAAKDNEGVAPSKLIKSPNTAPTIAGKHISEPINSLPLDPSKATPGFGTDNIPHIAAAVNTTESNTEKPKEEGSSTAIEPTTGLPIDTSQSIPGFDTDDIPHVPNRDSAVPSEAVTGPDTASTTYSSTIPDHHQSRTDTNNSEREIALAGRGGLAQHPTTAAASGVPAGVEIQEETQGRDSSSISSLSSSSAEPFGSSSIPQSPQPPHPSGAVIGSTSARGRSHPPNAQELEQERTEVSPIDEPPNPVPATVVRRKPRALAPTTTNDSSPAEGEEFEEARDAFDTEAVPTLPLPPKIGTGGRRDSPVRETRFIEEL